MQNFDHALEATNTALNSTGSAARENSRYMESLEAKTQQLKATFEDFANNVINSQLVKSLLSLANAFLQLLNTPVGQFATQLTLLTAAGWSFMQLINAMGVVGQIITQFTGATKATTGFGAAVAKIGGVITKAGTLPVILGISAALLAIVAVGPHVIDFFDSLIDPVGNATEKIEENNAELQTAKTRLEELESTHWSDRTPEIQDEIQELKGYIAELEEANAKLKENRALAFEKEITGEKTLRTNKQYQVSVTPRLGEEQITIFGETEEELIDNVNKALGTTYHTLEEIEKQVGIVGLTFDEWQGSAEEYYAKITNATDSYIARLKEGEQLTQAEQQELVEYIGILRDYAQNAELAGEYGTELSDSLKLAANWANNSVQAFDELVWLEKEHGNALSITETEAKKLIAAYPQLSEQIVQLNGNYYTTIDAISALSTAEGQYSVDFINNQIEMTNAAIKGAEARIEAYNAEQRSITRGYMLLYRNTGDKSYLQAAQESAQITLDAQADLKEAMDLRSQLKAILRNNASGTRSYVFDSGDTSSATEESKDILEDFRAWLEDQDFVIFNLEKNEANAKEVEAVYNNILTAIEAKHQELLAQGYTDTDDEIQELVELWWDYKEALDDMWDQIRQAALDSLEDYYNQLADQQEAIANQYQDQADAYQSLADLMTDYLDEEIEALQAKQDALDDANEALQEEIELEEKMDALARARQTKVLVWKDGHWQYVTDASAVSEAAADLEDYERDQALQDQKDALQVEIDILNQYKQEWADLAKDYDDHVKKMDVLQQLGIDTNRNNLAQLVADAQKYADAYMAAMQQMVNAQNLMNQYQNMAGQIGNILTSDTQSIIDQALALSGTYGQATSDAEREAIHQQVADLMHSIGGTYDEASGKWDIFENLGVYNGTYQSGGSGGSSNRPSSGSSGGGSTTSGGSTSSGPTPGYEGGNYSDTVQDLIDKGAPSWVIEMEKNKGYASGTTNARAGFQLVGENGPEMRVLNPGDGILPADATKNLWAWSNFAPGDMIARLGRVDTSRGYNITIGTFSPNLPNVQDGPGFAEYIRTNFWKDLMQYKPN